jgi:cell division protein FtsQ
MKINKRIINITLWSVFSVMLVVLLGFTGHRQSIRACQGLQISVVDETGHLFIEPRDILELLSTKGSRIKGKPMNEIDLARLEKIIYTNPFVERAEVFSGLDGYVNINIWQRNPVMRVINSRNEHFYIDESGTYFPVSDKYSCHVVVASGFIDDSPVRKSIASARPFPGDTAVAPIMVQLNEIAWFLKNNDLWDAQIEQIYVNEKYEIELIPRVGNQSIVLGNTDHLAEKMNNLMIFYTEAAVRSGWDKYSVINLKYHDQVICTKRTGS